MKRATPLQRLESKFTENEDGCWIWTAAVASNGYGNFWMDGRWHSAHRASYVLHVGPVPAGLELDHLCRNRLCVNPDHLEPVTSRVNTLRGDTLAAANAKKTHCDRGHRLEGDNLYRQPDGGRVCRTCRRESFRRWVSLGRRGVGRRVGRRSVRS